MKLEEQDLKQILLKGNYITETDAKNAEEFAKKNHTSAVEYFLVNGMLSKDLIGQALAESFGLAYSDLNSNMPSPEQVVRIPAELAHQHRLALFTENENIAVVTTDEPKQPNLLTKLQGIFPKKKIVLTFSLPEDIDAVLAEYRQPLATRFSKIIATEKSVAPEIIDEILSDALSYRASDVHFEPQAQEVVVRFRVDGVLQEAGRIPKQYYESIINRIKVRSRLRLDEHSEAQDGAMRQESGKTVVDLRVSIVPTVEGEKVVLRVLTSYIQGLALSDLGLSLKHQNILEQVVAKPFGMILVSGPTGSGKTTTLYAVLKRLNHPEVNITTIEDPVEYKVAGLNQIQINTQTNLTFAKGLRSIVRQDPDIILVGEIRDQETMEISINAALTGHLLLSTFHANDAATVVPRLLDMGAEPFLLASTIEVIIAQRLVRKICEHCRHSVKVKIMDLPLPRAIAEKFFGKKIVTLYEGNGCTACGQTGYKGRTAVYEFIQMTPRLQELILKSPSAQQIRQLVKEEGYAALFEDGVEKVKSGLTTLKELKRVVELPNV